jgi:hypothetical protein
LELSPAQVAAIVGTSAENSLASEPAMCTGFAIGTSTILASSHCWEGRGVYLHVTRDGVTESFLSTSLVEYPESGFLLVQVDPGQLQFDDYFSLVSGEPTVGQRIMAGGYGRDGAGEAGRLRFIVEQIASLDGQQIVITANGRGGMCNGDSGSPILTRRADGVVAALGLLLGGARSCRGTDVFIRSAAILPWLMEHSSLTDPVASCGTLSAEGRCFEGTAMWCDAGKLIVDACQPNTQCGYDAEQAGYRCLLPEDDLCAGTDGFGRCVDNVASTCEHGRLNRIGCTCGSSCGYDPAGHATCF